MTDCNCELVVRGLQNLLEWMKDGLIIYEEWLKTTYVALFATIFFLPHFTPSLTFSV